MCASGHSTLECRSRPQVQEKVLSWCALLKAPSSPYFHWLELIFLQSRSYPPLQLSPRAIALKCLKRGQDDQTGNEGLARHSRGSGGA